MDVKGYDGKYVIIQFGSKFYWGRLKVSDKVEICDAGIYSSSMLESGYPALLKRYRRIKNGKKRSLVDKIFLTDGLLSELGKYELNEENISSITEMFPREMEI